jgi:hypothetical protein
MSNEHGPQAGIYVDETHTYTVSLGRQTLIAPANESSLLTVRVQLPYDGQLRYDDRRLLKDMHAESNMLDLGQIEVVLPDGATARVIPVSIPAGADLANHLKSNKWAQLPRSIPIGYPNETLVTVDAQIFDGASLDIERLRDLIFGHTDAFVQDLRLHLAFWMPDMYVRRRQSRERELRELLLQRESVRQVFLPTLAGKNQLAESMAALANTSGGRILIGVDRNGQITGLGEADAELKQALLNAALRCVPAAPIFSPDYFETADGKRVARVVVPEGASRTCILDGQIYRREGATTVVSAAAPETIATSAPLPAANIEDALRGDSDDVIILDAAGTIESLDLGPSISALINAGKRDGLILIRNLLPAAGQKSRGSALQLLEGRVARETEKCVPRLPLRPAIAHVNGEPIGVLRVSSDLAPVALYDGGAYDWQSRSLRSLSVDDVFARYLRQQRVSENDRDAGEGVQLVYGELSRAIAPPPPLRPRRNGAAPHDAHFEVQRRAIVWRPRQFVPDPVTLGWRCGLIAQLRQALMDIGAAGDTVQTLDALRGHVLIRLNNVLASGVTLRVQPSSKILDHLPIFRRTNLRLQLEADTQALFDQRQRMSLLRLHVPDVSLDNERVADVRQACADLGFRIHTVDTSRLANQAILEGMRSEGFCDITLLVGMHCEQTPLTRALAYGQRTDSKATHVAALDIRAAFWGAGDAAAATIARLHMELHQLLHERLFYLRTE